MTPVGARPTGTLAHRPAYGPTTIDARPTRLFRVLWLTLTGTTFLLVGVGLLVRHDAYWRGLVAAATSALLAALVSAIPVAWALSRQSVNGLLVAYFASAALRGGVGLGACGLAVLLGGYPKTATLLLFVPFYFATLAAEAGVLARALWPRNDTTAGHPGPPGPADGTAADPAATPMHP